MEVDTSIGNRLVNVIGLDWGTRSSCFTHTILRGEDFGGGR